MIVLPIYSSVGESPTPACSRRSTRNFFSLSQMQEVFSEEILYAGHQEGC